MVTAKDIAWTAGFLEGEGYFVSVRNCAHVEASQVEYEPIEKLQKLFGGWAKHTKHKLIKNGFYYRWGLYGKNAIGLMMTIYDFMSPKRQKKIREVIEQWKVAPGKGCYNHLPNTEKQNRAISEGMKRSISKRKQMGVYVNH